MADAICFRQCYRPGTPRSAAAWRFACSRGARACFGMHVDEPCGGTGAASGRLDAAARVARVTCHFRVAFAKRRACRSPGSRLPPMVLPPRGSEGAVVRMLGFEPSQATVVLRAEPDEPTEAIQRLIEQAQQAGFRRCVLREAEEQRHEIRK